MEEHAQRSAQPGTSTSTPKQPSTRCTFCSGSHRTVECTQLIQLSIPERVKAVIERKLCPNCFNKHSSNQCLSKFTCRECGKRHHTLLHLTKEVQTHLTTQPDSDSTDEIVESAEGTDKAAVESDDGAESADEEASDEMTTVHNVVNDDFHAILATAKVPVFTRNGARIEIRALLDQGSQANFISERLCKLIGNETEKINMPIFGLNNANTQTVEKRTTVTIGSVVNDNFSYALSAYVIEKITKINPKKYAKRRISGLKWRIRTLENREKSTCSLGQRRTVICSYTM